jgi:hypothetical protein
MFGGDGFITIISQTFYTEMTHENQNENDLVVCCIYNFQHHKLCNTKPIIQDATTPG